MARERRTSARAAKAASMVLRDGRTSKVSRTAAASALSQRAPRGKKQLYRQLGRFGKDPVTMSKEFGRRVRELREAKKRMNPGFSLRRFAQEVGISATFLSKVETGEALPPKAENIKTMANLLDADPDELLALAGKVDPQLSEIIRERPKAMADLLRTARAEGLTGEDVDEITKYLRTQRREE